MLNNSWLKLGRIFEHPTNFAWSHTHAALPTPFILNDQKIRVFYTTRDEDQRSRVSYFDISRKELTKVTYVHDKPILELGELGTLDDRGYTSSFMLKQSDRNLFYYNGYNIGQPARYRVAIGVAESDHDMTTFRRLSNGPIMDRNFYDPCGTATPFIIEEDGSYRMWYTSFRKWEVLNGIPEPYYCIKHATSRDGINWDLSDHTCITLQDNEGGIVRPSVVKINGKYYMWYSIRQNTNYRENVANSYRIGFATSADGITWERNDHKANIELSHDGWDSQMVAYPYVISDNDKLLMFYNGNGFGQSGIGLAIQDL